VDTFEQRTQRPQRRQRAYYSGKKQAHTLKSQVAVDEDGHVVDVADSRPGRWADLKVFKRSGLAGRLIRAKVGALGDLGYVGLDGVSPRLRAATPRRKPRGQDRLPEDRRYTVAGEGPIGGNNKWNWRLRIALYECRHRVGAEHLRELRSFQGVPAWIGRLCALSPTGMVKRPRGIAPGCLACR